MRIWRFSLVLLFICSLVILLNSPNFAQEKEGNIPESKLPKKVIEAVQKKVPGAKILSAYVEQEEGELRYEITAKAKDVIYAIEVTANGVVREFSEEKEQYQEEEKPGEREEEKEVEGGKLYNFEATQEGKIPEGWSAAVTGRGPNSQWQIQKMAHAPSVPHVLVQVAQPDVSYHFNVAVDDNSDYSDVEMSVWLKPLKGKIDQGGGLVWRYKNADNYYIARANPLENNFRVYKVVKGTRFQLQSARIPLQAGRWYVMKIENEGNHIECYLDGKKYLDVKDDTFQSGKIGLWTKADAVTAFDNLKVKGETEKE